MAEYKIVIPTTDGTREGGYDNLGTDTNFMVDRGVSRANTFRVLKAEFGDGYSQRVGDGINLKNETYSVAFSNRPRDEVDTIIQFLDAKAGAISFTFYIDNDTVSVTCDSYNVVYSREDAHSLTAQFTRVYEV